MSWRIKHWLNNMTSKNRRMTQSDDLGDIVERETIKNIFKAYENEHIEELVKESKKRRDQVRALTSSDNKIYKAMIWLFLSIVLFLFFPLLICGCFVKGFNKVTWAQFGFCTGFFLLFYGCQKLLL